MSIMIEGYVGKKIYPNNNSVSNGDYKIYSFYPLSECRNNVNINNYGNITINGELPELYEEVLYTMEVEYVKKGKYENYTVKKIKKDNVKINEDVTEKFLKAILTVKQAKEVLKHYPNIIELVTTNKKIDVSVLYGIKEKTMKVIKRKIIENFQLMDLVNEYYEYGMTFTMVKNLYNAYPSIEVIKKKMEEDPYSCLCKINRVGFKTADNIIIKKYPNRIDSKMRADACIYYTLKESENSGNTYIKMVDLYRQFKELAPESGKWFKEILEASDDIHFHKETERVSLKKSYLCEKEISNKINELLLHNKTLKVDYAKFNEIDDVPLTEQQMNTLKNLCNYNISILAGVAGSGKSFSTKALIDMLDYLNLSYVLMSPTGKAAKVLSQFTNRKTSTIHRGLGYTPEGFTYNQDNKLPYDVVIIDEFSMIDIFLLRDLLRAIDLENTKVLFIGDPAQIPSVGVGNIAYDMLQSNKIPTTLLTTVFRYGEGGLSYVATKTRQGESYLEDTKQINIFGKNKDYVFINTSQENTLDCVKTLYNKLYYKQNISSDDILVLSAYNKGEYGTVKINSMIQDLINPKSDDKNEVNYKKDNEIVTLREGDKVIQTKNNYHAITTEEDDLGEQEETCVYNGDIGIITSIDKKIVYVEIDGKTIIYEKGDYEQLSLAYSLSYHKCLSEDTWIYTDKGLKQLKNLNNNALVGEFKPIKEDIKVFNGKYLERPSNFYNAGMSECKIIKTRREYKLNATLDHKVDVLRNDGYIETKYVKDITNNDYLLIRKSANIYGNNEELPKEWLVRGQVDCRRVLYSRPKFMTRDFARFLGYMVADGTVSRDGIKFSKRYKEVTEDFRKCVKNIFGYYSNNITKRLSNDFIYEVSSKDISGFCKNIDGIQPNNKFVPKCILESSKEYQCEFLKALFEDGTINLKKDKFDHIELSMKKKELNEQVRMMLLNMGIISTYYCRKNKYTSHILYIYKKDAQVFGKKIGFISNFKVERLKLCYEEYKDNDRFSIPYINNIMRNLLVKYKVNIPWRINRAITRGKITVTTLELFLNNIKEKDMKIKNDKDYAYLKELYENYFIDEVKNIESSTLHTYCLEMPETHKFIQNGISGWNCQGSGCQYVIMITPKAHKFFLDRNLLYVAETRAKHMVYHVGTYDVVQSALRKSQNFSRNTWLQDFLIIK